MTQFSMVFMKTFKALSYISKYLSYVYKTFHTQHNKFYNFITKWARNIHTLEAAIPS